MAEVASVLIFFCILSELLSHDICFHFVNAFWFNFLTTFHVDFLLKVNSSYKTMTMCFLVVSGCSPSFVCKDDLNSKWCLFAQVSSGSALGWSSLSFLCSFVVFFLTLLFSLKNTKLQLLARFTFRIGLAVLAKFFQNSLNTRSMERLCPLLLLFLVLLIPAQGIYLLSDISFTVMGLPGYLRLYRSTVFYF